MLQFHRRNVVFILIVSWLVLSPIAMTTNSVDEMYTPVNTYELAAPTITGPTYYEFENGTVGQTLIYYASDPNPKNYSVTVNGAVFDFGFWTGGRITVYLVQLYLGDWIDTVPKDLNFVCTVFNQEEESASASTLVRVVPDTTPPIIEQPQNITYEEGSFGHEISWNVGEANPSFFNITRQSNETGTNFTVVDSGDWGHINFTVNVDGLNATHWYIYTLYVEDLFGRNATSHVNVTVFPDISYPTITSPEDVAYEFGDKGYEVLWHAYDSNPKNYTITPQVLFNDTLYGDYTKYHTLLPVEVTDWTFTDPDGEDIVVSLDGLYLGNYTVTLTLYDDFGRMTNDSVNITVYRDTRAPIITSSGDLSYEEGYTGYSINWTAIESNPLSFNLTLDGTQIDDGNWDGSGYSIDVDGFAVGTYQYNMTYTDFFHQSAFSLIEVTVNPDAHPPTVTGITPIQTFSSDTSNNLSIQAYAWDLNNISSIQIQWGVGDPESVDFSYDTIDMETTEISNIFIAHLGNYQYGVTVWYKIIAQDDSSVQLVFDSGWLSVVIARQ
ncbi:MAG: hypothetical protein ACFFCP_13475, partial [Promethearchaeota archaeon]